MSSSVDMYGDCGAIPDARWNALWALWSDEKRNEYFASVASWGPLGIGQCEQLIQGLPPSPPGWSRPSSCLAEYTSLVTRLREDMARRAISSAPTAAELAGWCDPMNAALPEALVQALLVPGPLPGCAAAQTLTPVLLARWIPAMPQAQVAHASKPKRGRPKAAAGTIEAIVERARGMLMASARIGECLTQRQLITRLKAEGFGSSMSDENLLSRLKHAKLPTQEAAATAEMARSRKLAKTKGQFTQV